MPESLGTTLRVAREGKGMSIEQLSTVTKINPSFLEALETGRWDLLPGRIYLKPFVKLCGEALELDVKDLYEKIDGLTPEESRKQEAQLVESAPPPKRRIDYKLPIVLASLLIVTVLIAFAVKTKKIDFENFNKDDVIPARGTMRKTEAKWEKPWQCPPANPILLESQRLRLEFSGEVWACVIADLDTVIKGTMPAETGKTFTADSIFIVTLARNDRAVAYFNGIKVAGIGGSGKKLSNFVISPPAEDESNPDEAK